MKTWQRIIVIAGSTGLVLTAATGIALASIPDSGGVIHGCYKPQNDGHNSALGIIDTALSNGHCPSGNTELTWNQTGPQGPQGATGAAGAQGPAGPAGPPGVSGYQVITQAVGIGPDFGSILAWTISIPAGKQVLGAGIDVPGGGGGFIDTGNGPDPNDPSKWDFDAHDGIPNQGGSPNDIGLTLWITVASVSS
jgi:hypothetical protein